MTTRDQVAIVVKKQVEFNRATNGEHWLNGLTTQSNSIDFDLAIKMECAEAIDSFKVWKWWKDTTDTTVDTDNLQVEVVDILHFVISDIVRSLYIEILVKQEVELASDLPIDQSALAQAIEGTITYMVSVIDKENESLDTIIASTVGELQAHVQDHELDVRLLAYDVINTFKHIITSSVVKETNPFITLLEATIAMNGLIWFLHQDDYTVFNWDAMYKLYIGKNALNAVRQANGYKDGSYQKLWDGEEDNVYLTSILKDKEYTYDELVDILSIKYLSLQA